MSRLVTSIQSYSGNVYGLQVSYKSATTVTVAAGTCRDQANQVDITLTAATDAALTVSGAGGLDAGAEANSTWYQVIVISGTAGVSTLLHASTGAPTLPAGYTHYRRVGWAYNNAGGDIDLFYSSGSGGQRVYLWGTAFSGRRPLAGGGALAWAAVSCVGYVPPDARRVHFRLIASGAPAVYFGTDGATQMDVLGGNSRESLQAQISAAQAYYYYNAAGGGSTTIEVRGWEDVL